MSRHSKTTPIPILKTTHYEYYKKIATRLAALAGLALAAGSVNAATILNASFEDDDVANDSFSDGVAANWNPTGGSVVGTQDFGPQSPAATDGDQHGVVSYTGRSLSQLTAFTIADGETYTLTVDVGQVDAFSGSQGTIRLFGSTGGLGIALVNTNGTAELSGIAPGKGAYLLNQTVTYTALASGDPFAGQQIGMMFTNSSGTQTLYDNVRLDIVAVPEPSSAALLGLGGLTLIIRRRR